MSTVHHAEPIVWVAVGELKLSYHYGYTYRVDNRVFPNIVTYFKFVNSNPVVVVAGRLAEPGEVTSASIY